MLYERRECKPKGGAHQRRQKRLAPVVEFSAWFDGSRGSLHSHQVGAEDVLPLHAVLPGKEFGSYRKTKTSIGSKTA